MQMKRFMMSVSDKMFEALQEEMNKRKLDTVQEVVRIILSEHYKGEEP